MALETTVTSSPKLDRDLLQSVTRHKARLDTSVMCQPRIGAVSGPNDTELPRLSINMFCVWYFLLQFYQHGNALRVRMSFGNEGI